MNNAKHFNLKFVIALLSVQVLFTQTAGAVVCLNKLGGTYNFGVAPQFCNVSTFRPASKTKAEFAPVIFDDAKSSSVERQSYMSNLYPAYRDVVKHYLHRRNPKVSAAEEEGFLAATFTLATQESVWSHYRVGTDKVVRYMRGDSLHGYGFMQLDDRSHATQIAKGVGEDLIDNMLAGLDIYYAAWVQSKTARCISSASDYKSRARAAWAAYNGGPGSICRWTRTNSHDTEYLGNYNSRRWLPLVKNTQAASPINVSCLVDGTRPCTLPGAAAVPATPAPVTHAAPAVLASLSVATVDKQTSYRVLRECAAVTCAHVSGAVMAGEKVSVISQPFGEWIQVASQKDGHQGWLKTTDLEDLH